MKGGAWWIAGLVALALSVVFGVTGGRVGSAPLLRWGHAGVWALLAIAAFLQAAGSSTGRFVALAAGVLYVAFIVALVAGR